MAHQFFYAIKQVDKFIFSKLDLLLQNPLYQHYMGIIASLPQESRILVNRASVVSIILLPTLILLIINFSNETVRERVALKKDMETLSNKIIKYKNNSMTTRNQILGDKSLNSQSDLDQLFKSAANKTNNDASKFTINNFQSNPINNLIEARATVEFNSMPLNALMDLLNELSNTHNVRLSSLLINKNITTSYLEGSFDILHYGISGIEGGGDLEGNNNDTSDLMKKGSDLPMGDD
jgi:uncharacterized protein (DUF1778 family)